MRLLHIATCKNVMELRESNGKSEQDRLCKINKCVMEVETKG